VKTAVDVAPLKIAYPDPDIESAPDSPEYDHIISELLFVM
jgi:hypothetical protein